jgi:hypothetical protein
MDPDALASLPASHAATLIADGARSPVDLLEVWLAGATVEDVQLPASFAACREMIACVAGAPSSSRQRSETWSCSRWPRGASAC